jgi:hypothetical protein
MRGRGMRGAMTARAILENNAVETQLSELEREIAGKRGLGFTLLTPQMTAGRAESAYGMKKLYRILPRPDSHISYH